MTALDNGLILNLPLNEGSGTKVLDRTGGQSHGTLAGSPVWVAGKLGGLVVGFDGVDDTVSGTVGGSGLTTTFTLSLDFYFTMGTNQYQQIIALGSSDLVIFVDTQDVSSGKYLLQTSGDFSTSIAYISSNAWHHLLISCNGSGVYAFFVDGKLIKTASLTQITWTNNNYLINANNYYQGAVANLRFYNRVLSIADSVILSNRGARW